MAEPMSTTIWMVAVAAATLLTGCDTREQAAAEPAVSGETATKEPAAAGDQETTPGGVAGETAATPPGTEPETRPPGE